MQQVSRAKSADNQFCEEKPARNKFHEQNSVSRVEKSIYKFYEEKNQHATSLRNKRSTRIRSDKQKLARNRSCKCLSFEGRNDTDQKLIIN